MQKNEEKGKTNVALKMWKYEEKKYTEIVATMNEKIICVYENK